MSNSQSITSAKTSLNQVSAVYKKFEFTQDSLVLDYGGGKYDKNIEYMDKLGVRVAVYDPYNRTEEHNNTILNYVSINGGADYVVCANVLNVIKEVSVVEDILYSLKNYLTLGGTIYIQIYEGDKSGIGSDTIKGYQRNCKTVDYMCLVAKVFNDSSWEIVRRSNFILIRGM